MKAVVALVLLVAIGAGTTSSANAEFWIGSPSSGFDALGRVHRGGPYFVAGFGDDILVRQRRYWGGPSWVICGGVNPPFDTYRRPPHACRQSVVKIAARDRRRIRVRSK
jgi:hypothetical protein